MLIDRGDSDSPSGVRPSDIDRTGKLDGWRGLWPRREMYRKLSPGPGAPHEQVVAHQRFRICRAVIDIVAGEGYRALTVRKIVRLAGISTHTFYELFDDKDDCFLETYRWVARCSARAVIAAQRSCGGWEARLRSAFYAFAQELANERDAARLALVEAFSGGEAARERMRGAMALYETMLARSLADAPDAAAREAPPLVVKAIVSGIARISRMRLIAGRANELPLIADELASWTLALLCPQASLAERLLAPAGRPCLPGLSVSRHGAPHRCDERERILDAVGMLAAQEGFSSLTAPRIRIAAGVSRRSFDANFKSVQDCFSTSARRLSERALACAAEAGAHAPDWPRGVYLAAQRLCQLIAADPVYAKLAFIEALAPGPQAVASRDQTTSAIAKAFLAKAPSGQRPDELAADASVGAAWGLMYRFVLKGLASELPRHAPLFAFLVLAPAIGGEAALEAIEAEGAMLPREPRKPAHRDAVLDGEYLRQQAGS